METLEEEQKLILKFSHNIVEHLGIKLYQNKPTNVVAELISNSWDADAKRVWIDVQSDGEQATVSVEDTGHGMDRHAIVTKYLVIGKPKRKKDNPAEKSPDGRDLMGRKGIGKLAPFGIANVIDVATVVIVEGKQLLSWFRLNLQDMKDQGEVSEEITYSPLILCSELALDEFDKISPKPMFHDRVTNFLARVGENRGTMILMSQLSTLKLINPDELRSSIGRRLTVTLLRSDFNVEINGKQIGPDEALPKFEFYIGSPATPTEETIYAGGTPRVVKFWIGFVKEAKWPQDEAGVGVYAHGKIAQDRPFTFGNKGKEIFTRYMYAVVEADWVDELKTDVVSTDRTSIDWQMAETKSLYEWGQRKVSAWVAEYEKWRREQRTEESVQTIQTVTRDKKLQLSSKETEVVAEMLSEMSEYLGKDEEAKYKAAESLAGAWIHLPMREMTKRLWDIFKSDNSMSPPAFVKILDELHANLVPEALSLSVTFAQRIYALTVLEDRVHLGSETDLQKLIERFTWILDPTYEKLTANQELKTIVDKADSLGFVTPSFHGRTIGVDNLRPDFTFFSPPGEENLFRVIELKNPQYPLIIENVEQLRGYLNYLEGKFPGCDIKGTLIGKDGRTVSPNDPRIVVTDWGTVLRDSRKGHVDLLAAMLSGTDVRGTDARVGQVVKYGGQATVDMLNRLSEKDEPLKRLMEEIRVSDKII